MINCVTFDRETMSKVVDTELNERQKAILNTIVQLYILKASPIGSRFVAKFLQNDLKLSPATIRNVMADLEEMELISHPHTSAGRVPTDKGYRYYVNHLLKIEELTTREKKVLQEQISSSVSPDLLKDASKVLGVLSHYLSLVELPDLKEAIVEKIELVKLSSTRVLVVVALDSKDVRTVTLEAEFDINHSKLTDISSYINEKARGRQLKFLKENFAKLVQNSIIKEHPLIRLFIESVDRIFNPRLSENRLIMTGTQNLLKYPEFEDVERIKSVIEIIENEDIIIHIIDQREDKNCQVRVFIGGEMNHEALDDYSLILSSYSIGNAEGSIGLIGPKRMNYSKMASLVYHVANLISQKALS